MENEIEHKRKHEMDALWQTVSPSSSHVEEEDAAFAIFHPCHTTWGSLLERKTYQQKYDTMRISFVEYSSFRANGLCVLREYKKWCEDFAEGCYLVKSAHKMCEYLKYRIDGAVQRWTDDKAAGNTRNSLIEECAYNSFRSATPALDALAHWQGYPFFLLDEEVIITLRTDLLRKQWKSRAHVQDYAASSRFICKRITEEESKDIIKGWWNGDIANHLAETALGRERTQMRGLLLHCLQNTLGRRGADLRNLRVSMFFTHKLPNVKPVSECLAIGASLRHVKECRENVEHLLGWVRSRNRWECPLGALAVYVVWLNDIHGFDLIQKMMRDLDNGDGVSSQPWWEIMLVSASSEPISYTTHNHHTRGGFVATNAGRKLASTHIYRTNRACDLIERGESILDVGLYEGWYHDAGADRYLRASFKTNPMLLASGWEEGNQGFACWWECAEDDIPRALLDAVLPGLDVLTEKAEAYYRRHAHDRSAVEVCKVLKMLRKIYISDSIHKRDAFPAFPAYARHPLFIDPRWHAAHEAWEDFKIAETSRIVQREASFTHKEHKDIRQIIKETFDEVLTEDMRVQLTLPKIPVIKPSDAARIPEVKEPKDLYTTYNEWQQIRSFFYENTMIPWKKQYGELATAMKLRYSRMRPFLMYLDKCGVEARDALHKLDAIRKKHNVTPSAFIKQCFYHMVFPPGADAKNKPAILPDDMKQELRGCGLPMVS